MRTTFAVLPLLTLGAFGQTEYFPLHAGNQWVYRSGVDVRVMEILRTQTFNGREYALLRNGFAGDAWLRMGDNGTLYALDPASNREAPWVAFATPEGGTFPSELDPCNRQGIMTSRQAKVTSPAGEFSDALEIRYPAANCADAGLDREFYGKWIGLVQRVNVTIIGPRVYDLVYARIGGVTVLSEREVTFSLTLDRSSYEPGQPINARLTLRHTQNAPLELNFNDGQTYEIVFRNEKGDVVYRWSDGKGFTQALRREAIPAGERNYAEMIGIQLAAGKYVAEAWITSNPKTYSASVGFEVR